MKIDEEKQKEGGGKWMGLCRFGGAAGGCVHELMGEHLTLLDAAALCMGNMCVRLLRTRTVKPCASTRFLLMSNLSLLPPAVTVKKEQTVQPAVCWTCEDLTSVRHSKNNLCQQVLMSSTPSVSSALRGSRYQKVLPELRGLSVN